MAKRVRLGAKVVAIMHGDDDGDGEVRLASGDFIRIPCDNVVCTLPIGVLRAGTVAFEPPLDATPRRHQAGCGGQAADGPREPDPVQLKFAGCFWCDPGPSPPSPPSTPEAQCLPFSPSVGWVLDTCPPLTCPTRPDTGPWQVRTLPRSTTHGGVLPTAVLGPNILCVADLFGAGCFHGMGITGRGTAVLPLHPVPAVQGPEPALVWRPRQHP